MREILLYGLRQGETERYTEVLLATNCKNDADIEKVKTVAGKDGFHSFRIAYYNGEAPDFTGTINKK
jgi:hypothetical protein